MQVQDPQINVLFFGRVADQMQMRELKVPFRNPPLTDTGLTDNGLTDTGLTDRPLTLHGLRALVFSQARDADLTWVGMRMSVNQVIVDDDPVLHPGDEVAFFSIFSGG